AQRYLLTGDEWTAEQAYQWGLIQELVEPGEQFNKAMEIAEKIAKAAPLGVQGSLKSSKIAVSEGQEAAKERLFPELRPVMASEDVEEGVQASLGGREAGVKGKQQDCPVDGDFVRSESANQRLSHGSASGGLGPPFRECAQQGCCAQAPMDGFTASPGRVAPTRSRHHNRQARAGNQANKSVRSQAASDSVLFPAFRAEASAATFAA